MSLSIFLWTLVPGTLPPTRVLRAPGDTSQRAAGGRPLWPVAKGSLPGQVGVWKAQRPHRSRWQLLLMRGPGSLSRSRAASTRLSALGALSRPSVSLVPQSPGCAFQS